ncbi:melanocyte-stimulating hormone receptor-like [Actinia tenebrosa]|uniref:Melanocyte-stimulating hormone receptor-like n=1 Tax=Actinia tenebrosa TaxID=6105 RepID=A0A6P8JDP5_ACTTE|nr:melanocyte-stimulating hormone receptor-like [Actinia tenebrosa]
MNNINISEILLGNTSFFASKSCFTTGISYNEHKVPSMTTMVINGIFSPIAVLLNSLIILIICRTTSLQDVPENILIAGLSLADLLTGVLTQPLFVLSKVLWLKCNGLYSTISDNVLVPSMLMCSGSAFVFIAALSLEKVLALHFHLRYNSIITTKRTWIFTGTAWLSIFLFSLLLGLEVVDQNTMNSASSFVGSVCIVITLVALIRILTTVKRHRRQISAQISHIRRANPHLQVPELTSWQAALREIKRAINLAYFVGLYFIFFTPHLVLQLYKVVNNIKIGSLVNYYVSTETILFIRASFSPVVWLLRKREFRNALKTVWAGERGS